MAEDLDSALQAPGCERLREWVEIGPVQRAALETFAEALAEALRPEIDFRLRGTNMCFSIGNQEFQLAYEPTEPGEFEFMKRMLLHAFRRLMRGQERAIAEPWAWTPVAQALPQSGVTVLACYRNRLGNLRRIRAQWIAAKTEEADSDDAESGCEYDEKTDTYWTTEGWYERIDNWSYYSTVAVTEGEVTHWMPLPPAPDAAKANERTPRKHYSLDDLLKDMQPGDMPRSDEWDAAPPAGQEEGPKP